MNSKIDPEKARKIINVIINILSVIAGALGACIVQSCM